MRKKIFILSLIAVMVLSCALLFTACDKKTNTQPIDIEDGSRPDYASLFTADDLAIINEAMAEDASEDVKKQAVMVLYNTANKSRMETELSLVIQNSDVGLSPSMGQVIMHAFNLRQGDAWYYQLVTDAVAAPGMDAILQMFAGILKVAYTAGDGDFYSAIIKGGGSEMSCKPETFPYATFKLTQAPQKTDEETFLDKFNCLQSMHEINNMAFISDIIAEGAEITYNSEEKFYTVKFEIDTFDSDPQLLKAWYAMPQKDMLEGGNEIENYSSYEATLQVWDNGYAKYFISHADRNAGMASGKPIDEFNYFWNEDEIMSFLEQDVNVVVEDGAELTPADYIAYYSGREIEKASMPTFYIIIIVVACVIALAIIAVVVVEVLVRCGKLPKLAAKRAARKEKRLAKRAAKKGEAVESQEEQNWVEGGEAENNVENDFEEASDEDNE